MAAVAVTRLARASRPRGAMDLTPLVRLVVAGLAAAAIGLDRELRSKAAGFRTNIVVAVAAAAFTYAGAEVFTDGDPTRIASQVVSGIGFLGGGAIFAAGGRPHGLTTAAALWGSAALGLAAGSGDFLLTGSILLVTLVALWPLDWLSEAFFERVGRQEIHLQVILPDADRLADLNARIGAHELKLVTATVGSVGDRLTMDAIVSGSQSRVRSLLRELDGDDDLVYLSDARLTE